MNAFSVGLLAILACEASTLAAQDRRLTTISEEHRNSYHVLDRTFRFVVMNSVVAKTPRWARPREGVPPLPMKKAITIAQAALRKYVDDPGKWRLNQITLRSVGKQPMWYYVVEWCPAWDGYLGDGIGIPVLMSGEAVALETEPDGDAVRQ